MKNYKLRQEVLKKYSSYFKRLNDMTNAEQAEVWFKFVFECEWPTEIGDKPDGYPYDFFEAAMEDNEIYHLETMLCERVQSTIGDKGCMRYANVQRFERYTDQEFDDFWDSGLRNALDEQCQKRTGDCTNNGLNTSTDDSDKPIVAILRFSLPFAFGFLFGTLAALCIHLL